MPIKLFKRDGRIRKRGIPVGLSACWGIKDIPEIQVLRIRPWDDFSGPPAWAILSDRMVVCLKAEKWAREAHKHYIPMSRRDEELFELFRRDLFDDAKARRQEVLASQDLADLLALEFEGMNFSSRREALKSIEGWLLASSHA